MNQILSDRGGRRNKNKQLIRAKSLINIQGIFHMGMTHWEVLLLKLLYSKLDLEPTVHPHQALNRRLSRVDCP